MKLYPILIEIAVLLLIGLAICHADDIYSREQGMRLFMSDDLDSANKYAAENHGFIKREKRNGSSVYVVYFNQTVITHRDINFEEAI